MSQNLNMNWEDAFSYDDVQAGANDNPLSVSDALVHSVHTYARVDMNYICALTGLSEAEAVDALGTSVFFDSEDHEWKTADDYLSGNFRRKLKAAEAAIQVAGGQKYITNAVALRAAIPPRITANEIHVTLDPP